ncbi:glucosaminidase domain-containing protein [Prevotella sp.]|uniref:glucosaminidase domain-containing protein n=1 Tax=Prevotella sp. TaxID=59823 RepID=UPI0026488D49|nr:glucosaminidase domain-containing protein [Prevotella sp.]MDN5552503.1 glucosaminidase domain-containing protein [Prevotella sp.]
MAINRKLLVIVYALLLSVEIQAQQYQPDALPSVARVDKVCDSIDEPEMKSDSDYIMNDAALTAENVLAMLQKYDVKFPKIVLAQALLETGNFSSDLCRVSHNLFGLRHPSDGSYYVFNKWEESVKSYRDDVQYKYTDGDYYSFLSRIGYAEDRNYTSKVKRIANTL